MGTLPVRFLSTRRNRLLGPGCSDSGVALSETTTASVLPTSKEEKVAGTWTDTQSHLLQLLQHRQNICMKTSTAPNNNTAIKLKVN